MIEVVGKIILPNGKRTIHGNMFLDEDIKNFSNIYKTWIELNDCLTEIGGRKVGIPSDLTEGVFCMSMGKTHIYQIKKTIINSNSSMDCYDFIKKRRIQIKASGIGQDLSSFGPNSEWDDLYYMDFFPNGKYDGEFHIYAIPENIIIDDIMVNSNETVKNQKDRGLRPRFSIFNKIIKPMGLMPIKTGNLLKK